MQIQNTFVSLMIYEILAGKLLIDLVIPGILATTIILLFPKIYNSIEHPKPVTDIIGIRDTLAITAPGGTLIEYFTDITYIWAPK